MSIKPTDNVGLREIFSIPVLRKSIKAVLFISLVSIPLFIHLEKLPIRVWDESRLAINAYEMYQGGNWLVPTFDGKPDMWNTKPPLMIWLQVICMKLFGVSELALRLPSAIAGLFTVILLFIFLKKWFEDFWPGFIASIILITSYGYLNVHVTRTGDYDSLLVFFLTGCAFSFYNYIETSSGRQLLISSFFLWLGIMTKGVQGLLFIPGLFVCAIVQQKSKYQFLNRNFLFTFSAAVLLALLYYAVREQLNPGYWNAVWQNEINGRYLEVKEGNNGDAWFYFDMLSKHHYAAWFWLLPAGFLAGVFSKKSSIRKITWFSFIIIVSYGLIISFSKTKLEWYEAPMFPFMAIPIAVLMYQIFILLKKTDLVSELYVRNVLPYLFLFLLFYHPYRSTMDKVYFPKENEFDKDNYTVSYFLKDALKGKYDIADHIIFYKGYHAHLLFYKHLLTSRGINVALEESPEFKSGDRVIISQAETGRYIIKHFKYEPLMTDRNLKVIRITKPKPERPE